MWRKRKKEIALIVAWAIGMLALAMLLKAWLL